MNSYTEYITDGTERALQSNDFRSIDFSDQQAFIAELKDKLLSDMFFYADLKQLYRKYYT